MRKIIPYFLLPEKNRWYRTAPK